MLSLFKDNKRKLQRLSMSMCPHLDKGRAEEGGSEPRTCSSRVCVLQPGHTSHPLLPVLVTGGGNQVSVMNLVKREQKGLNTAFCSKAKHKEGYRVKTFQIINQGKKVKNLTHFP